MAVTKSIDSLWQDGIPLDKAPRHFSPPKGEALYLKNEKERQEWQEEYWSLPPEKREKEIELEIGGVITTTLVSNVSKSVFDIDFINHTSLMEKLIVRKARTGKLVGLGYALPRNPSDVPQIIPPDLWNCEISWSDTEIKGNGLHFISVRLICTNKVATEVKSNANAIKPTLSRQSELHQAIGKIIFELRIKKKDFPSADEVWREVKKKIGKDGFECLQSIDFDKAKNEEAISWISMKGNEQKLLKTSFLNIISEFRTGKKKLPDSI